MLSISSTPTPNLTRPSTTLLLEPALSILYYADLTLFWHSFFPASNMSVCKCTISSTSDEQNNRD